MASYTIGNRELLYKEVEIPVSNLKFYAKNPRVYTILNEDEMEDPDQDTIYSHMQKTEHVKALRLNIRMNGGLINPILVSRDNVVIEGNSRLAAYKLLQDKDDPIRWGKIRCHVFQEDLSDDDIFNLLCAFHVNGRKDWNPMEQAGLLYRRQQECMRPIEEIAKERGMKSAEAKNMVTTFSIMKENDDMETSKWSYYEEFRKIEAEVKKNEDAVPDVSIRATILDRIKDGTIGESKDLRKIGKLLKLKDDHSKAVLVNYVNGTYDIDYVSDVVSNTDVTEGAIKQAKKLRDLLGADNIAELLANDEFAFELKKIKSKLNSLM